MITPDRVIKTISIRWKSIDVTFPNIITGKPRTKPMLKILVPIMFPRIISNSFFFAEVIAITSSGADVPTTRIIIVINFSLMPILCASSVQLFTARSLPIDINISPIIAIIIDFEVFHRGFSFLSKIVLCFLINSPIYIRKARKVPNKMIPSILDSMAKMIMVVRWSGSCFLIVSFFTLIGLIRAATPMTNMVLTIVLPITLANTRSPLPFSIP